MVGYILDVSGNDVTQIEFCGQPVVMLVKYVGGKVMMVKNFLIVCEDKNWNVCPTYMSVKYLGEKKEQKFECMFVMHVGETFSVYWRKVRLQKIFVFFNI